MAQFKPCKIASNKLNSLPIIEGQLIITTDTKKIYLDASNSNRILLNEDVDIVTYEISKNGNSIVLTGSNGQSTTVTDNDTTYTIATQSANGLMSAEDKKKLDGIAIGAQVNTITGVKGNSESAYRTGNINITKTNIGLGNVENKSSATIREEITSANVTTALGYTPINSNLKGASNGLAELDVDGKVLSNQLPSYVDDVLEYNTKTNFPETGETGKIYIDKTTNKTYRWGGTAYVEISSSLALGTTSSTAFRGDQGKTAYDHATAKGSAFSSGLYKITTNAEGHVTGATTVAKSDITALGIPAQDTTYGAATTSAAGLMSSADKTKLDGIAAGAQKNTITGVKGNAETSYRTGNINITATNIGLGNVENKSSKTIRGELTKANVTTALGYTPPTQDTNTTYTLTQDATDGHKITLTPSSGNATTITIPDNNTTYTEATTSKAGLMSAADKTTLDGLSTNYLAKSGGQITGPISFKNDTALPAKTLSYVAGIDSFSNGGQMGYSATSNLSVGSATKATQDSIGQQINSTYIKELSISGKTIIYTKGDGTTKTITPSQDTSNKVYVSKTQPENMNNEDIWFVIES